ncbi:MAG: esterase, partial [Mycobacterium sp.]
MTAPSKVSTATARRVGSVPARPRRYPVSDGAPVEVIEDGPGVAARLVALGARVTMWPALAVLSHVPH